MEREQPAEFDRYAQSYRDMINPKAVAVTGEAFEYFINLRVGLMLDDLRRRGEPEPQSVLDFGCGIGATEAIMRSRIPGARLHGVDPSRESIKVAESQQVPDATFQVCASVPLPFDDGSFDVVYSNGTFHHIDHAEHPAIFRELARVLRPGGHAFVFENNPFNPVTVYMMRTLPIDAGTRMLFPHYLARLHRGAGLRVNATRFYVFFPKQLKALRWSERHLGRVPVGAQYYVWGTKAS
jgi:ubiquinone/menaquinone biosynthesis C-methylase UbiE